MVSLWMFHHIWRVRGRTPHAFPTLSDSRFSSARRNSEGKGSRDSGEHLPAFSSTMYGYETGAEKVRNDVAFGSNRSRTSVVG